MAAGASTEISFTYTIPCDIACGVQLDYNLTSFNTFTDFCRALDGNTSTALHRFGFEQVQAIEQLEDVDYGILNTGQSATRTAKFQFQYKQHNMDFTNAAGELRINYSQRMEVDPNSILINGVAPTNPAVIVGDNSTGASPDTDSVYVVTLTMAELTTLFDNTSDNLWYDQTYYGCDVRQDSGSTDDWQLIVQIQQNPCTDGSTACAFDVASKKAFVYTSGTSCPGVKPCYVNESEFYRENPGGFTATDEATPISPIDSSRSWAGDTVVFRKGIFMRNGDSQHEPNGFWTAQGLPNYDMRTVFSIKYSTPVGWNEANTIWTFLENISTVSIYERTPVADVNSKGTIGAKIIEVPLILSDFSPNGGTLPATAQHSFNATVIERQGTAYPAPVWYCNNGGTAWQINGICPVQNRYWYDLGYDNIHQVRYKNVADNKIAEAYYLNIGKALARAGWTGNTGDDNFYFEVKTKWQMSEDFPWDNSNSFHVNGYTEHLGDFNDFAPNHATSLASSYNGSCNTHVSTHLTTSKEHYLDNPNSTYNADCDLEVNHDIFFKTYEGDYFLDGEVRVPLKIDSVVIDLPSEYGLTAGTYNWQYNQSCGDLNSTAIDASATAGHIVFTNSGGGDFPRADDCSGNKVAYQLRYTIEKTGTAAPTQYKYPVVIYGYDEANRPVILRDSVGITEAEPELTLSPITPVLTPTDGGTCEPAAFEFQIQNTSLFDASNVYFAIESSLSTTAFSIDDGDNTYTNPITTTDVTPYGTNNLFAKVGTIEAGEIRTVRVLANTNTCSGDFDVYADFGCAYPSPLEPNLASTTIDQASAQYIAQPPGISTLPVAEIEVQNLCDVQTVEVEIRNIRLGNLYNGNASFELPDGAVLVSGTEEFRYLNLSTFTWESIPAVDVTQSSPSMLNLDLSNITPFNTTCGLPGADEFTESQIRIRFNIDFTACPTASTASIPYTVSGENYCGTETSGFGVVRINYIGNSAAFNDYEIASSPNPITVCAPNNEVQAVSDTMIITNIGGYGIRSGTSTGDDRMEFTVVYDDTNFDITDITLNAAFDTPTFTTDANGSTVINTNVPAGIAVDATQEMILSYNLTPKIDNVCLVAGADMCYSAVIKSEPDLSCTAKSLNCTASYTRIAGHEFSTRDFQCCNVAVGNLVFSDRAGDGIFDNGTDRGINGVTVELYPAGGSPGVDAPMLSTTTAGGGFYLFDQLTPGDYIIYLPASNFVDGAPLNGATPDVVEGTDNDIDDSGDENGQSALVAGGIASTVISLQANTEPTGETGAGTYPGTLDDDDVNMTIDFGFMPAFDYPDNGARLCTDAPCHAIDENLRLGTVIDSDSSPDGGTPASSQDDGISILPNMQFIPGNTVNIPVSVYNNTGNTAYLRLWVDWNGDEDFDDPGEQIADTTHSSSGVMDVVSISTTVPVGAVQAQDLAIRARLSTDNANSASPCSTGDCAADGEVEDFTLRVGCATPKCLPVTLTRQ